jgi:hypothetical protein
MTSTLPKGTLVSVAGRLGTNIYDKRDHFNIPIVKFPFICSNIPAALAYGVYICQMIRYSRAGGSYQDVLDAQWDRCDQQNYLVKRHHLYSGT